MSRYAENVWQRFADRQDEFRRVFSQLVSPLPDDGVTRRIVPLEELGPARGLAEEIAATRLLTIGSAPDGTPTVDLAHESLIRHWPRLAQWVVADREFRQWQDEMDTQVRNWRADPTSVTLPRGRALTEALTRAYAQDLTESQQAYLTAAKAARYGRVVFRTATAIGLVIALAVGTMSAVNIFAQQDLEQSIGAAQALAERARGAEDVETALPLAARAFRTADILETRDDLRRWSRMLRDAVAVVHSDDVDASSMSPNPSGTRLAVVTKTGDIQVWDLTVTPPKVTPVPRRGDRIGSFAWLGDKLLADVLSNDQVSVWNAETGAPETLFTPTADLITADARGRWFAYATSGSPVVHVQDLIHPETPAATLTAPGPLSFPRQSPPDAMLLRGVLPTGAVLVQSVKSRRFVVLTASGAETVAGEPGGDALALGGDEIVTTQCANNHVLVMRGVVSGKELARHAMDSMHNCEAGVFSSGGEIVATVSSEGLTADKLLSVGPSDGSGQARQLMVPHGYQPLRVTRDADGSYRLLLGTIRSFVALRLHPADAMDTALSLATDAQVTADGRHVVIADGAGVQVWDTASRQRIASHGGGGFVLSTEGTFVAQVAGPGAVTVSRLPSLASPRAISVGGQDVPVVRFVDSQRFAVRAHGEITVWDAGTGRAMGKPLRLPLMSSTLTDFLVAPIGGDEVVVETHDRTLHVFRLSDGKRVGGWSVAHNSRDLTEPTGLAAHDGLVAVVVAGNVEIWDIASQSKVASYSVPDSVSPLRLRFRDDSGELEIYVAGGVPRTDFAQAISVLLWKRDLVWGLPKLIGRSAESVHWLDVPAEPGYANSGSYESGGIESGDPAAWLAAACRVITNSGLDTEPDNLPAGAWQGPVCTKGSR